MPSPLDTASPVDAPGVIRRYAAVGIAAALVLMIVAMVLPHPLGWNVHAYHFPPLAAYWQPRFGPGTLPALALGAGAMIWAPNITRMLRWGRLLVAVYLAALAWMVSLATVDGLAGIGAILNIHDEYLGTARHVTSISTMLHEFISRIPLHSADNWPIHVAGHPPGALLFFVVLVRLGLGGGLAAGMSVVVIAASTPVAVLIAARRLGDEVTARRVAAILTIGPAAIWMAVSADAVFAADLAWGLCLLAVAATARSARAMIVAGVGAGLLLGYALMLSYGLVLAALPALAVLVVARTARPLPWVLGSAAAVVLAFAAAGFAWWDAYPVLRARYWAGSGAQLRPAGYWLWANLAALCFSAGPVLGVLGATVAALRCRLRRAGDALRPVVALPLAAALSIVVADASLMSKAEVERIWLPFVPWLLLGCALLPRRWQTPTLAGQIAVALLVQSLLRTRW